jgi:hypothetical protein
MGLPPALLVRKGRINLGQTDLILELNYRKIREHTSSGRNKNDEEKFMPNSRLGAPVQIYGSDFWGRFTKFYEKDRKRKISTCAAFANAGQD